MFFSVDGLDGAGKSTQVVQFVSWLEELGYDVVQCRDPGGTPLGEAIRQIVLHGGDVELTACSEMLLYMASRAQLVNDIIRPALGAGKIVVSDRYLLANVVYQGYGCGLPVDRVWQVGEIATGGVVPDMTFVLDIPVGCAAARIQRKPDRMEGRGIEFMDRVRQGFLTEAARLPHRVTVIDANRPVEQIRQEIRTVAAPLLKVSS